MDSVLIGLLGALVATNQPAALSNLVVQTTGVTVSGTNSNDSVEREFRKLMEEDDEVQAQADRWIKDNDTFATKGAGLSQPELRERIRERLRPIGEAYADFIKRHPNHVRARLAYASFLGDLHEEDEQQEQLEKALALNCNDPAVYNNLANIYGHTGPVKKAFEFYAKAIALNPVEPLYYHNFGTTVYLFRKDAMEFYKISEQEVFDKALGLYATAMKYDPKNFPLASDVAQTYYGIRPSRTEDALRAWTNALSLAHDELEREGVFVHLARIKLHDGRLEEARAHLNAITNEMYAGLKTTLTRNLKEEEGKGTNAVEGRRNRE